MKERALHIPLSFDDALRLVVGGEERPRQKTYLKVIEGDSREKLKELEASSVHLVLTDPPYFLDGLDNGWRKGAANSLRATGTVGGLPVGMKFDPKQGKALQEFMEPIARELYRILVPGGFFVSFSQPRLFHRLAIAAENAGFEIRDMYAWRYTKRAQFKAFSLKHFVEKMEVSDKRKREIVRELKGRKTPQLRPQFEAILLSQKRREGGFIDNWLKYKAGMIDAKRSLDGSSPSTVMTVEKTVKDTYNVHLAVKPVLLLSHLIELFTCQGQLVLDPFLGTGSTALAAKATHRSCVGIEINREYVDIAERRIKESKQ